MQHIFFDNIYSGIIAFSNYKVLDIYICRLIAYAALAFLLYISRLLSSFYIKLFAVAVAMILYFFPELVRNLVMD